MKFIQKVGVGFFSLLFTSLALMQLLPATAFADTAEWVDVAHIKYGDTVYTDESVDQHFRFYAPDDPSLCEPAVIHDFEADRYYEIADLGEAVFYKETKDPATGCAGAQAEEEIELTLNNVNNSQIGFYWVDEGRLESAFVKIDDLDSGLPFPDLPGGEFVRNSTDGIFYHKTDANCKSSVKVINQTTAEFTYRTGAGNGCLQGQVSTFNIGNTGAATTPEGEGTVVGHSETGTSTGFDESCESAGGVLGWIMCPLVNALDGGLNWVDTQIQALLEIDKDKYTNPTLKQAWVSIRNIAYIILIPVMLVMVIGTALGVEVFSAYTIKKALPRMVIAVIFITFSWYITAFLINFFNVIGSGVLGLLTQPFRAEMDAVCQNGDLDLACLFSVDPSSGNGALRAVLALPQALAIGVGLIIFLIFFGGTILLATGAAFMVLLARQVFIIALLLMAPLAILAWIFPGNDKLWKTWWSAFSKLLIMFPLIMAIIAVGRIFAFLLNTGETNVLTAIMKLIAYILPYIFIPFTFKFAGGLFANLAGMVNDRQKGIFDRQKQKRAQRWSGFKDGAGIPGFRGGGLAAKGMKRIGTGLGAGWKGRYGFGAAGAAVGIQQDTLASKQKLKDHEALFAIDEAARAATYRSRQEAETGVRDYYRQRFQRDVNEGRMTAAEADRQAAEMGRRGALAVEKSGMGWSSSTNLAGAIALAASGTGYEDKWDEVETARRVIEQTGHGANAGNYLAATLNSAHGQSRRHDLASSFGTNASLFNAAGAPSDDQINNAIGDAMGATDVISTLRDRGGAFRNHMERQQQAYNQAFQEYQGAQQQHSAAIAVGDTAGAATAQAQMNSAIGRAMQAETILTQFNDSRSYGTVENQGILDDTMQFTTNARRWLNSVESGQMTNPRPSRTAPGTTIPAQPISAGDLARSRAPKGPSQDELERRGLAGGP